MKSSPLFISFQLITLCNVNSLNFLSSRQHRSIQHANRLSDTSLKISREDERRPSRRDVLTVGLRVFMAAAAGWTSMPLPGSAGEVGARITKAVTTSDLGISVRTSVVKGAQVMDKIDGKWEQFSDRFSLGSERSKRDALPKPKLIPEPLPLDVTTAKRLLSMADEVFLSLTKISPQDLTKQIEKVSSVVRSSFERSGLVFSSSDDPATNFSNGPQFNYALYCHYKAYSDLIIDKGINFGTFRPAFQDQMGQRVVSFLLPLDMQQPAAADGQKERLRQTLNSVDYLCKVLKEKGFVALTERSTVEDEKVDDWLEDMSDLQFSVALDGDVSQNAQILLQEQGFRLYPSFASNAVAHLMQQPGQKVSCESYYFDTDYNSDPAKFEVKEVLLSCILESA